MEKTTLSQVYVSSLFLKNDPSRKKDIAAFQGEIV